MLNSVAPFFIVDDLEKTLDFYQSRLAFEVLYKGGGRPRGFLGHARSRPRHADVQSHYS